MSQPSQPTRRMSLLATILIGVALVALAFGLAAVFDVNIGLPAAGAGGLLVIAGLARTMMRVDGRPDPRDPHRRR